ncbi:MAG: 4-(cytidine 5'-diphospho)-2-C-methyl-D-erythritol kinase [Chitinophagaceae bacterium]|nr:4-(cytidine 5'-diphospho)-2-C-methyl-D-erythritol kinase [Chitinophagaceae bacterium]
MLLFPNAKINLGLSIVRKRSDGYHDLETVFAPVAWCDALEFVASETTSLHVEGISVTQEPESNIVWKAYQLMLARFPFLPPLELHLLKNIPHGAGLGGGSSDAAFLLKGLKQYFNLDISEGDLMHMALQLGSDCPFFIYNRTCYAEGRGEIMSPITLKLSEWQIVLIKPPFPIPTAKAFQGITPKAAEFKVYEVVQDPVETWRGRLVNDFEAPLIPAFPQIQWLRDALYAAGCTYASLSGSGSTVFGLFREAKRTDIEYNVAEMHKKIRDLRVQITDFNIR